MSLSNYSEKELKDEIEKRSLAGNLVEAAPTPVDSPDFKKAISVSERMNEEIMSGEFHEDNDFSHYIYEEFMRAVYGKDYFKWYNSAT